MTGRRYRTALVATLIALAPVTSSALESELLHAGTEHDALLAIDVDAGQVLAGGYGVGLIESHDGGGHWEQAGEPASDSAVLGIASAANITLAVGQQGRAWRREGDGPWEAIAIGPQERWLNVDLHRDGTAVAVGGFGALAVSRDAGRSWSVVTLDWSSILDDWFAPHLYDVTVNGDAITVVGEFGLILRSDDRGGQWRAVATGDESLFAISLLPDGSGYVVGQDGYIASTADYGESWTDCDFRGDSNLFGVSGAGDHVVAVGMRRVLVSGDRCRSFESLDDDRGRQGWWQAAAWSEQDRRFLVIGSGARMISIAAD